MKLPKLLIGALVIGLAVQTAGCKKETLPKTEAEKEVAKKNLGSCPACGMG